MIDLPKFKIGDLEINLIQGAMGVGISWEDLPIAVANCGGAGIIASVELGPLKCYKGNQIKANQDAFRETIRNARKKSNGVIGVNIMHALTDYEGLVKVATEEGVDLIISGAGMAENLPKLVGNAPINLVPIVSDVRAARIITNRYWSKYGKIPDAIIVEGPDAGGHLGFKYEDLVKGTVPSLEEIAKEVIYFANNPKNFEKPIPVIVAGGIYTGADIRKARGWGAVGAQLATRFVTTKECDADDRFKWAYVNATKEDIGIIKSPVGMPGRAILNSFLEKVMEGEKSKIKCNYGCLKTCNPNESRYCIAKALIEAQKGNLEEGFAFAGTNAYRAIPESCLDEKGEFITVRTLMERISDEYHSSK
ncbi:nitronate monooxygenase [Candidatus Pacearchaeota archaeon]|nr:nitronate monooxygenase [Candidatus Pacearchaeota archaeon]